MAPYPQLNLGPKDQSHTRRSNARQHLGFPEANLHGKDLAVGGASLRDQHHQGCLRVAYRAPCNCRQTAQVQLHDKSRRAKSGCRVSGDELRIAAIHDPNLMVSASGRTGLSIRRLGITDKSHYLPYVLRSQYLNVRPVLVGTIQAGNGDIGSGNSQTTASRARPFPSIAPS